MACPSVSYRLRLPALLRVRFRRRRPPGPAPNPRSYYVPALLPGCRGLRACSGPRARPTLQRAHDLKTLLSRVIPRSWYGRRGGALHDCSRRWLETSTWHSRRTVTQGLVRLPRGAPVYGTEDPPSATRRRRAVCPQGVRAAHRDPPGLPGPLGVLRLGRRSSQLSTVMVPGVRVEVPAAVEERAIRYRSRRARACSHRPAVGLPGRGRAAAAGPARDNSSRGVEAYRRPYARAGMPIAFGPARTSRSRGSATVLPSRARSTRGRDRSRRQRWA